MVLGTTEINSPLVSVIIPAYHAADLIAEAIQSVQCQIYPHWQVIVVEDGTQDDTELIVQTLAQQYGEDQVKYIRHPQNRGLSATRNTGIGAAGGKYIALLDHDDTWQPQHLEKLVTCLEQTGADLAFATANFFEYHSHTVLGNHAPKSEEWANFPHSLYNRNYIPVSSVVMKREVIEKVGGFDPQLKKVEDLDYWLRCVEKELKFEYVSDVTNGYRQRNPRAMTADKSSILEWHARVLRKHCHTIKISKSVRDRVLARYHLGVVHRTLKTDPAKAWEFFYWSLRIAPLGSLAAIRWFVLEALGLAERYA